jgi:hypothetical protein
VPQCSPLFTPGQAVRVVETNEIAVVKGSHSNGEGWYAVGNWFGAFFYDNELKPANDTKTHKRLRTRFNLPGEKA